jgi:hypothetical protein
MSCGERAVTNAIASLIGTRMRNRLNDHPRRG